MDGLRVAASRGIAAPVKQVGSPPSAGLCLGFSADSAAFRAFQYMASSTIEFAGRLNLRGSNSRFWPGFRRTPAEIARRNCEQFQRSRMALLQIRPRTAQPNGIARIPKAVANSNDRARANYVAGAMEAPLPLTPERLELIKAYAESRSPHTDGVAASRIAQRFAPRPPVVPSGGDPQPAVQAPLTAPFFALASGIRRLTAVLVVAALLPNLTLAAFWLHAIDMPWSEPATPPSKPSPKPVHSALPPPVLSAPSALEASAGQHVSFPITLDGTDAVPPSSVIVISGLPQGSRLSSGYRHGATEWTLKPDEIGDLHLVLPAFAVGEVQAHHSTRRARRSRRRRRLDHAQLDRRSRHCRSRRTRNHNRAGGATNP